MAIDASPAMLPVSPPATPAAARKAASHQVIDRNRACIGDNRRRARPNASKRGSTGCRSDCAAASTRRSRPKPWRAGDPTADHVDALVALVDDEITFGDYLAAIPDPLSSPSRREETTTRMLHRRRPYLIPGTTLLRNNFGADTQAMLADLEFVVHRGPNRGLASAARRRRRRRRRPRRSVRSTKQLFADVYAWAGDYRVTELRLGDDVFARQSSVHRMMDRVEEAARGAGRPAMPNAPPTHWPINSPGSTPTTTTFIRSAKATGEPAR